MEMKVMEQEILLVADTSQAVFYHVWQEFNSRGFSITIHRDMSSVITQFPVPGSFCGLLLIDTNILTESTYDFCRSLKQQFADASLVLLANQVLLSTRYYLMRLGAAEMLAIPVTTDVDRFVEKITSMLQSHISPTPHTYPSHKLSQQVSPPLPTLSPIPTPNTNIPVKLALDGIHQLSRLATTHFNKYVVTNYWQVARSNLPEFSFCLDLFAVEYNMDIRFKPSRTVLTPTEVLALRRWTAAFIERCQEAMEEFPLLLQEEDLLICAESFRDSPQLGAASRAYIH
jgi:FixJ family two-component response regulator